MLGKKEEGNRWGKRKEQEKDGSEAVLCHVYFCLPGPTTQDDRGDPPEDGALLSPLSTTQSDPFFVTCVALLAFRGLFHGPLIRWQITAEALLAWSPWKQNHQGKY